MTINDQRSSFSISAAKKSRNLSLTPRGHAHAAAFSKDLLAISAGTGILLASGFGPANREGRIAALAKAFQRNTLRVDSERLSRCMVEQAFVFGGPHG